VSERRCRQHQAVADYRCDGCSELLCDECIEEGHALLFCRLCGERALPLAADQPASSRERRRRRAVSRPYGLVEALGYPFRGSGKYLYAATLLTTAFLFVFPSWILRLIFAFLLAALQLKIVETTANGDDELPDWPDLMEFGERAWDMATWLVIYLLQILPALPFAYVIGRGLLDAATTGDAAALDPDLAFSLGTAATLWLGTALGVMAFGAAGAFGRLKVLSVHHHLRGFLLCRRDALVITNMIFGCGALVLVVRTLLETFMPLAGIPISGALGAYWLFVNAHLPGVLFRRHLFDLERLYG